MTAPSYVPDSGDIIWINFNPQTGREQAGYRPAVVLSPLVYNSKAGLIICCPMTTKIKGYPFEVTISGKIASVVLVDQIKSLDWRKRGIIYKGKVSPAELERIRTLIKLLIS